MRALDTKLLRDFGRLWAQVFAIALVVAGGVASLVLAVGSFRSLDETRTAYYERNNFADVFATVSRAPNSLLDRVVEIPGVAAAEARIVKLALLDVPEMAEPAAGMFISLPESGEPMLNRPYMRMGRMPEAGSVDEVLISENFANAQNFVPGSRFSAILNGRKRELVVAGVALSPEFIYAIGPGDLMPDDRRFGVFWMPENTLASIYNLEGAFSSVSLALLRNASEPEVIKRLDDLLDPYGGSAAYGRKDQISNAFLEHGLAMLQNIGTTLPPIFLLVTAFLVNLTLSRLVALEREQVGLLKALGYRNWAIAWHYLKFVLGVALLGVAIGSVAGTWLGAYVTQLFAIFYRFPFLVFAESPDVYVLAAGLSLVAAVVGAFRSLREVVILAPAVAMQPPAPPRFRHFLPEWLSINRMFSQPAMMMLRNIGRHPLRAALSGLGIALATAVLIVSMFTATATDQLINVTYFVADRQDASIAFVDKQPLDTVMQVARLPGVLAAEPDRALPVRIRYGSVERRMTIRGRPRDADLSRIIDTGLRPVTLPESGLAISTWLASKLGVRVGDSVEIDLLEGQRRTVSVPVTALVEDYFGIKGMMDADALSRLMREAPTVSSVDVSLDSNRLDELYAAVKSMPAAAGVTLQRVSVANFRGTLAVTITMMGTIYTGLAVIIAFGVIYNSARISLSERARELASLRVLGFTRGEVMHILLLELALITVVAQPPGWLIGYGLALVMKMRLAGDLMRVPMVLENLTYILASGIVVVAALFSAAIVAGRLTRLDLVAVLKTRE